MSNKFKVGDIVECKVIDVKPFGAFVSIDENTKGLIHISQLSNKYVKDINDCVKVGDTLRAKIISCENSKIGLSVKEAIEKKPVVSNTSLEDKLKDWLKDSNDRQAALNKRNNRR